MTQHDTAATPLQPPSSKLHWLTIGIWWTILMAATSLLRPLLPIDETRVFAVAWEMWNRNDWLVPHLDGEPYSHKPPLLQWGIMSSWLIFGVGTWPARLIAPFCLLLTCIFTRQLVKELYPKKPILADQTMLVTGSSLLLLAMGSMSLYEIMLVAWVAMGHVGMLRWRKGMWSGLCLAGLACGLGILTKGPVVLLHVIVPWLIIGCIPGNWRSLSALKWWLGPPVVLAIGALIGLAWALPAAAAGGEIYANQLLWGQTSSRLVNAFHHKRPFYYYIPFVVLAVFPWCLWPASWRSLAASWKQRGDFPMRFTWIWLATVVILLSAISSKQVYYLSAVVPAIALLLTAGAGQADAQAPSRTTMRLLAIIPAMVGGALLALVSLDLGPKATASLQPGWYTAVAALLLLWCSLELGLRRPKTGFHARISVGSAQIILLVGLLLASFGAINSRYDLRAVSQQVAEARASGRPVLWYGLYYGQFAFYGRLTTNIDEHDQRDDVLQWCEDNPDGLVFSVLDHPKTSDRVTFMQQLQAQVEAGALEWAQIYRGSFLVATSGAHAATAIRAEVTAEAEMAAGAQFDAAEQTP